MTDTIPIPDGEDISDFNSDEDTEVSISTYKTARQLAVGSKRGSGLEDLQELGTVAEKKSKFDGLTESEIALRREENARRRKNQTDQRLEEEKQEARISSASSQLTLTGLAM